MSMAFSTLIKDVVSINLTDKISKGWIRDLGVQSLSIPKTDWCFDLMLKNHHQERMS